MACFWKSSTYWAYVDAWFLLKIRRLKGYFSLLSTQRASTQRALDCNLKISQKVYFFCAALYWKPLVTPVELDPAGFTAFGRVARETPASLGSCVFDVFPRFWWFVCAPSLWAEILITGLNVLSPFPHEYAGHTCSMYTTLFTCIFKMAILCSRLA